MADHSLGNAGVRSGAGAEISRLCNSESWIHGAFNALACRHDAIGDIRGLGSFLGVELVRDRLTREPLVGDREGLLTMRRSTMNLLKEGLLVHGRRNILLIAPPLVFTEQQFSEAIQKLDLALTTLESQVDLTAKAT